jgi:hypothetical protein
VWSLSVTGYESEEGEQWLEHSQEALENSHEDASHYLGHRSATDVARMDIAGSRAFVRLGAHTEEY